MKKTLALACFILALQISHAQDRIFKPFKVNMAFGYAQPTGTGAKGGAAFSLEPKYAVLEQLSVGLRLQVAATGRADESGDLEEVKANASYAAMGDYYFTNTRFRPFAGLGAGYFQVAGLSVASDNESVSVDGKFGGVLRGGFEFGHLRAEAEYNLIGASQAFDFTTGQKTEKVQNRYWGIKLGFNIGGGRYKNKSL